MLRVTVAGWAVTLRPVAVLLALDWCTLGRRPHQVRLGEAARGSVFYVLVRCCSASRSRVWTAGTGGAVLHRIRGREEPFGGQPVRVRAHHRQLRGPGAPAGEGPHHRHRARAEGRVHRSGSRTTGAVLVRVLDLRVTLLGTAVQLFRNRREDPDVRDNALVTLAHRVLPV